MSWRKRREKSVEIEVVLTLKSSLARFPGFMARAPRILSLPVLPWRPQSPVGSLSKSSVHLREEKAPGTREAAATGRRRQSRR